MSNNQLPSEVREHINEDIYKEAQLYAYHCPDVSPHIAYTAGATEWAEKAQVLLDALEKFISYHETGLLPAKHIYEKAIVAREQWKGKEVDNEG